MILVRTHPVEGTSRLVDLKQILPFVTWTEAQRFGGNTGWNHVPGGGRPPSRFMRIGYNLPTRLAPDALEGDWKYVYFA